MTLIKLAVGLGLLIAGAEILVRGASRLAAAAGISPLVVGLTVVAFGTSSPELAVSLQSAWGGQADIALGNVVGSNIFNVLFILGLSALVTPLLVARQLVHWDVPLMIGISALSWVMGLDGRIGRLDGLVLVLGVIGYTAWSIRASRREGRSVRRESDAEVKGRGSVGLDWALIVVGLGMLVLGSRWMIAGAMAVARMLGVSELIIGLTLVAGGTSLPEVATSVVAAARGERDIAVGNVVGSNIFNILAVLGCSSLIVPTGIGVTPAALGFDIPVMIAVAAACLPIFFTDHLIARWEGALFLGYYVAYVVYLFLGATGHDLLPLLNSVMVVFVLPLTAITLLLLSARAARRRTRA